MRISSTDVTAKSGPPERLVGTLPDMSARLLAVVLLLATACGPAATARNEAPSSAPVPLPIAPTEPGLPTPTPTPGIGGPPGLGAPTPEPPPLLTREIAGMDF